MQKKICHDSKICYNTYKMAETKIRILIIDDETDFCYFAKNNLEVTGTFEVITANDGDTGIQLAKEKSPDLILLDLIMPEMSGDEVAQVLMKDPQTKNIPVLFLTAIVTKEETDLNAIRKISGNNFLPKVIETEELVGVINRILGKSST